MNVIRNQPFHVAADHDGIETDSYDLLLDGAVAASQPVASLQAGVITFSNVIVTTVGAHTTAIRAVGTGGTAVSATLPFDVVAAAPNSLTNIRLIIA